MKAKRGIITQDALFVTIAIKELYKMTHRKRLIRWKIYVDRAKMYIGYVQFLMIVFVLLESYKDSYFGHLVFDNIYLSMPIIVVLFVVGLLVVGRIDTMLGLREEELRNNADANPVIREILENTKELKKEIEELKTKQL